MAARDANQFAHLARIFRPQDNGDALVGRKRSGLRGQQSLGLRDNKGRAEQAGPLAGRKIEPRRF